MTTADFSDPNRLIVSGALHYFRVLPQQWSHRLRMLRAMGANAVETYVPWNLHERRRGVFDFTGLADLEGFLRAAADEGLAAIVRPGPYICAEWENGGLPVWLPGRAPRTVDPGYLAAMDAWFDVLVPKIAAHQVTRGGNVFAVQVENEYGSYGSDLGYLRHVADGLKARGIDVPLFTSDGPEDAMLTGGTVPGVPATVNFGSRPAEAFAKLKERRPDDRAWCMEFWNGWFDHWTEPHHTRDPKDAAGVLAEMLDAGASVNIYMAHGGTNFGTWAGANHDGTYQPTVTSYDYDAPIDERGAATEKYRLFREVIGRHLPLDAEPPAPAPVLPAGAVELAESLPLRAALTGEPRVSPVPLTFEELGIDHGVVVYRHDLRGPRETQTLTVDGLHDRALVHLDGVELAVLERDGNTSLDLTSPSESATLELIVESMGRVNYGPFVGEHKGVTGVRHRLQQLHGWETRVLELDDISGLPWGSDIPGEAGPGFHRGHFDAAEPADGFLALPGWVKGYVWVNGFLLGRYWNAGPQKTLYTPWPLVKRGRNEVVVLEMHPTDVADKRVRFESGPDLG
ncbi:beta-galactosidase [Actinorhabdospora filicis]|uniref:Beta-galactosidase n=1 Tax=Actinorhabdospora filicis TaxID=1785913 RepID=A0A9W6WD41_9ACTN|nr:beta-galactosidase [Actinorhabdospora filicis]